MRHSRRHFLTGVASLALVHGQWADLVSGQPRKGARLILLGTKGGPRVGGRRRNPSTLILINDVPYVIDCGNGTSQQLLAAGVALEPTTLRAPHPYALGPHARIRSAHVQRLGRWTAARVDAYGPPPLRSATQAFWEYVRFDVDTRIEDEGRPDPRPLLVVNELDTPRVVLDNDDVKITSAAVIHPRSSTPTRTASTPRTARS